MKVCFHWFNLSTPPGMSIGASLLARELADAGHQVRLLHLNEKVGIPFDPERLRAVFKEESFDLHALSFGQNHYPAAMQMASLIKSETPASLVLCGGVHTTLNAEEVLARPGVDFVGLGEVDGLLARFVSALEKGSGFRSVPNFWGRQGDESFRNPMAPLPDISDQTQPFFDGVDYAAIIRANRGFAETVVGRGCPMKCNYCHNAAIVGTYRSLIPDGKHGIGYCRFRSVDGVIAELKAYQARYADILRAFNFGDDRFASSREWLGQFSARYATEIGLPFICNAIAGQIDDQMAGMLADAGCYMVKFGVESGSARVRREILARELSETKLEEAVSSLRQRGINTRAYVMLGMPTETREEMLSTISLCANLGFDSVRPAVMYPFPGTELYRTCLERDLIDTDSVPTDYSTTSVLRLSEPERDFIEKTAALYAWLLNEQLGGEARESALPLVREIYDMKPSSWSQGEGRNLIGDRGSRVHESLVRKGVEHYFTPFADRPDVIFLHRQRTQPLINIEDSPGQGEA